MWYLTILGIVLAVIVALLTFRINTKRLSNPKSYEFASQLSIAFWGAGGSMMLGVWVYAISQSIEGFPSLKELITNKIFLRLLLVNIAIGMGFARYYWFYFTSATLFSPMNYFWLFFLDFTAYFFAALAFVVMNKINFCLLIGAISIACILRRIKVTLQVAEIERTQFDNPQEAFEILKKITGKLYKRTWWILFYFYIAGSFLSIAQVQGWFGNYYIWSELAALFILVFLKGWVYYDSEFEPLYNLKKK